MAFIWDVAPELFTLGPIAPRWYGVLFGLGYILGYFFVRKRMLAAGETQEAVDALLFTCFLGGVIGARLGHCFFYEPAVYLADPMRILKIWEGGLASHGGALGLLLGFYFYVRKYPKLGYMWILDCIVAPVAIAGALIRIGNFFNSEILGKVADPERVPWAVIFKRYDMLPRHPAMLYESVCYFLIGALLYYLGYKRKYRYGTGLEFGLFLILVFGVRFFIEFFKEVQVGFERGMVLNMGQLLSIPMVLLGVFMMIRAYRRDAKQEL